MAHNPETRKQVYEAKIGSLLGAITQKWQTWLDAKEPVRFWVRSESPNLLHVTYLFKTRQLHIQAVEQQIPEQIHAETLSAVESLNQQIDDESVKLEGIDFMNRQQDNAETKRRKLEDFYDGLAKQAARQAIAASAAAWFPNSDFPVVMYGIAPERVTHFIFSTREQQAAAEAANILAALEASMIDAVAKINQTHDKKPLVIFIGFANSEDIIEAGGPYNYFR